MNERRASLMIAFAGIVMQIVTGIVVVNVAISVIETRLKYTELEVLRLRQWREQVVDPALYQRGYLDGLQGRQDKTQNGGR